MHKTSLLLALFLSFASAVKLVAEGKQGGPNVQWESSALAFFLPP